MRGKKYGLVISDWNMEPMTGYDLLREVRADPNLATTPFIMITAESKTENVIAAKKAGVNNYIVKPFNAATLKTKIEAVFLTWRARKRASSDNIHLLRSSCPGSSRASAFAKRRGWPRVKPGHDGVGHLGNRSKPEVPARSSAPSPLQFAHQRLRRVAEQFHDRCRVELVKTFELLGMDAAGHEQAVDAEFARAGQVGADGIPIASTFLRSIW